MANKSSHPTHLGAPPVTVRLAGPQDSEALERLAQLDSSRCPTGDVLVAEVDGQLRAAAPLSSGPSIADPFHPTASLVELLELRAAQYRGELFDRQRPLRRLRLRRAASGSHARHPYRPRAG